MINPTSKADLAGCKAGYYELCEVDQLIAAARDCGLNVDEQDLRCQGLKEFFQKVLGKFSNPPASATS